MKMSNEKALLGHSCHWQMFCNAESHPPPPSSHAQRHLSYKLYQFKNYLKWRKIQLPLEWRVGALKDHR